MDFLLNDDEEEEAIVGIANNAANQLLHGDENQKLNLHIDIEGWRVLEGVTFSNNFRMSKVTFQRLVVAIGNTLIQEQLVVNLHRTPLDVSLMMALWILANSDTFRSTGIKFGVPQGTVFYHYLRTITALTAMAGRYICWPDADERLDIAHQFEQKAGFSGCVGEIDGVMLYVTAPLVQPQRYVNRHHTHSISAQVVCDHRKLFRDVYVGEPGSVGDAATFQRSPLFANLHRRPEMLSDGEHIIGDQAYPLSDKVQIPFLQLNADERQINYNFRLSSTRSIVERSFALLKEKFQRLRRIRSYSLTTAIKHIMSCLVLHNFIILGGEALRENIEDNILPDNLPPVEAHLLRRSAERGAVKREYMTVMLWNNNHN